MTLHYPTAILHTTRTHSLVTDHQRRPTKDRFLLNEKHEYSDTSCNAKEPSF